MNYGNCFNIEYVKKFPFVKISKSDLFSIFYFSVIIGFLAFIMETILEYIFYDCLLDRGLLTGPFIPIYFFCIFFGLLYLKTPTPTYKNFIKYIIIIGGGISLVEFIIGNICELIFNEVLWSYEGDLPFSYKYVSLSIGLIWGVLGTLLFMFVLPFFKKIPDRFSYKGKILFINMFLLYISIDILITINIIKNNNWNYDPLYDFDKSFEISLFILVLLLSICLLYFIGKNIFEKKFKYRYLYIMIYILSSIMTLMLFISISYCKYLYLYNYYVIY